MSELLESKVKQLNRPVYDSIIRRQRAMPQAPFDVDDFCREVDGVDLDYRPLDDELSGLIMKNDDGGCQIYVNSKQPEARRRFTAAHEMAHFLLHKDSLGDKFPENMIFRNGRLNNKQETEANKLAAEILMPYRAIDEYISYNSNFTIRQMAKAFHVSPLAMAIRLGIPTD